MPVRTRSSAEACGSKQLGNRTHPEQRLLGGGSDVAEKAEVLKRLAIIDLCGMVIEADPQWLAASADCKMPSIVAAR
jgi:hypothetical protein